MADCCTLPCLFMEGRSACVRGKGSEYRFTSSSSPSRQGKVCALVLCSLSVQSRTCFTFEEEIPLRPGLVCSVTVAWEEANTWRSPVHHDTAKCAIVGQVTNPRYHVLGEEVHEIIL